jgi:hypothetical protein
LQTAQGCVTPNFKITRASATAQPNHLLELQRIAAQP